jgi:hypothetical protein
VGPDGARPAARSPSDRPLFHVGENARFDLVFEVGPQGIREGGAIFLQASPFWDWDSPQLDRPDAPGFTRVEADLPGVSLDPVAFGSGLMAIEVAGRALEPRERIRIVYGAGRYGTRVDRYAERGTRIWFAVDGDGDGVRALVDDPPRVDIRAREAARLIATLQSTAEPGSDARLTLAFVDAQGNAGIPWRGVVTLTAVPAPGEGSDAPGVVLPAPVRFEPEDGGRRTVTVRAAGDGVQRLRAVAAPDGSPDAEPLAARSNPLVVREGITPVRWADLHGHSQLSDGTGTPTDFYDYARNVAALDVAALTDHDHWGMRFLDAHPEMWDEIRTAVATYHEPGRFVTLLGYEWTSWLQGHRHVLYFSEGGQDAEVPAVLSSVDPRYETPDQLWDALRGRNALTFAHHSAGGPVSTNWSYAPPPDLEPVTEIVSVHGSSEAPDSPASIYDPVPGNFVRDALRVGYRFGFIGSGDSHDGHPGLADIASGGLSGLAAIRAEALTRQSVLEALRAHRTYATNGPRIFLETALEGTEADSTSILRVSVAATAPVSRLDFIRTGLVASLPGDERLDLEIEREIPPLRAGEFLYVRVVQRDGGAAWSSPFYGDAR